MNRAWQVRTVQAQDLPMWAALREALWPDAEGAGELAEISADFVRLDHVAFVAVADDDAVGMAEASLRREYVNGTGSSPVAFLEGWYVRPDWRGRGVGRSLVDAVAAWAREQGMHELASDSALVHIDAHRAHAACGFEETERVVYFRRTLD